MENINIFFTIDNGYAGYLATAVASILSNVNENYRCSFYILEGEISDDNKRKINLLKSIKDFDIEYLLINKELFKKVPDSSQAHISKETNYRFLISSLKPNIDKCIFIDADLVFEGDIAELWNTDVKDYYIAAVPDQAALQENSWTTKLPLPDGYVYVNTGVCVVNLKKWRQDNVESQFFENTICYTDLLRFPDQDILNITLASAVKYLSHRFNAMPVQKYLRSEQEKEAFESPVVIHWAGNKPWKNPSLRYADVFWKYAKMTPFYEDIFYKNLGTIEKLNVLQDAICLKQLKRKYMWYQFLSKIAVGQKRKLYNQAKKQYKDKIKKVKEYFGNK